MKKVGFCMDQIAATDTLVYGGPHCLDNGVHYRLRSRSSRKVL